MQLTSCKRLLGVDDSSHKSDNTEPLSENREQQMDVSIEKGPSPMRQEEDDESKYPPLKTVILSMLSIFLAFFLSALVSLCKTEPQ